MDTKRTNGGSGVQMVGSGVQMVEGGVQIVGGKSEMCALIVTCLRWCKWWWKF